MMSQGARKVTDEEIVEVFRQSTEPAMFAKEIADQTGYTRQGIANRLDELVGRGELRKKKSGRRSAVYWLPSDCW